MAMQRLQHEAVAAECAQHIGVLGRMLAVALRQHGECRLRVVGLAGEEGDASVRGHRVALCSGLPA
jgi:hypothetical protein